MGTYSDPYRPEGRPRPSQPDIARARRTEPPRRVVDPRSSQESYDELQRTRAHYDRERASRDPRAPYRARGGAREVIDARGSIDSRTFNESHEISSRSRDERDRPRAAIDTSMTQTRWHSRAGQGFDSVPDAGAAHSLPGRLREGHGRAAGGTVGFSGGVVSGRSDYGSPSTGGFLAGIPLFFKVTIPIIVVLVIVLVVLLLS